MLVCLLFWKRKVAYIKLLMSRATVTPVKAHSRPILRSTIKCCHFLRKLYEGLFDEKLLEKGLNNGGWG